MKLIVVSDLHADWHTDGYERLEDVAQALAIPVNHACNLKEGGERVTFICLGDVSNPGSRNMHRALGVIGDAMSTLNNYGIPNIWLTGNHDVIEDGHGSHVMLGLKAALHGTRTDVIDRPREYFLDDKHRAIFLPYTASSHDYDPAEVIRAFGPQANSVWGHLSIPGILYQGSETTDMPRGRNMIFPTEACAQYCPGAKLFNGHYHRRQVFRGITVPGSLVRLTHGEESNDNGYLVTI